MMDLRHFCFCCLNGTLSKKNELCLYWWPSSLNQSQSVSCSSIHFKSQLLKQQISRKTHNIWWKRDYFGYKSLFLWKLVCIMIHINESSLESLSLHENTCRKHRMYILDASILCNFTVWFKQDNFLRKPCWCMICVSPNQD